ncbi:ABC transporter permease [Mesorhizobium sp. WSM4887]|uniref:ABC transporter permease n=1 Tax=Mesorhizobium sp. WSM4887 TaxID=3038543 RepID=UPI0024177007|nr:ABC transporter permease [Mesorhizobium sp. WSM4887]MDG4889786.1 ABC transporter permease [Mesorhizobium sp. WSM4887]
MSKGALSSQGATIAVPVGPAVRPSGLRRLRPRGRAALAVGIALLVAIGLASLLAPYLTSYDPIEQDLRNALRPPDAVHIFGTDNFGRDIFARVLYAAKLNLTIGILCVLFPSVLGVVLGGIAGYFGGFADTVIMRVVDTFTAFPFLIMVIGIIAILGPGLVSLYIALTLAGWTVYARIVRAEVLVAKKSEYILAARALGFSNTRIIFGHVLPNVIVPALIFAATDIVLVILSTTSLSFLGLGVQPPTPEWGTMIAEGRTFIMSAWWMVTLPGLAIVIVSAALSLFSDGLADTLRRKD